MSAIDTLNNIISSKFLPTYDFKYCLVNKSKLPYTIYDKLAKPNDPNDFVSLLEIANHKSLESYAGIGISIKASKISAIDIDGCFKEPFDINSGDSRAQYAINLFKEKAYIEFSFSGKGLRILFKVNPIKNYSQTYYIKNSNDNIEYYYPEGSARYVTLTGKTICDNSFELMTDNNTILEFLNKYMKRPARVQKESNVIDDTKSIEELLKIVRNRYLVDFNFQELWFNKAEGSGNGESDHDFFLLQYIYINITKDPEKARLIFEASPRFKSKDQKHIYKWEYNDHRYFKFMWQNL